MLNSRALRWSVVGKFVGGSLLILSVSCTSAKGHSDRSAADTDNGDSSTGAGPSGSPSPSTGGQPFAQGSQPVPIAGVNLVDYNTARVNCGYQDGPSANTYNAQCVVVSQGSNGQEVAATGLATGVTLNWASPQSVRGAMSFNNCAPTGSGLGYTCLVAVTDPAQLAEAQFGFQLQDKADAPRQVSATVVLPYAINVAAGFIPNMPYRFVGQTPGMASEATPTAALVGNQHFGFTTSFNAFSYPLGICQRDSRLFFADNFSVYQVQNGQITQYAGSGNAQNTFASGNKLAMYLFPTSIACTADAVYVAAAALGRIYKLQDNGLAQVIGGTGDTTSDGPDGAVAATAPISDPESLVVDAKGNVVFTEQAISKVRYITPAGLLQTLAGSGSSGYAGDGGLATQAALDAPVGLAAAADGSIYIADAGSATVRKVDAKGIITTVAGTGVQRFATNPVNPRALSEPQQVGLDSKGNLFVSEHYRGIKQILANGNLLQVVSSGADILQATGTYYDDLNAAFAGGQTLPFAGDVLQRPWYDQMAIDQQTGAIYINGAQGVLSVMPTTTAMAAGSVSTATVVAGTNASTYASDCSGAQDATTMHLVEGGALAIAPDNSIVVADWLGLTANQIVVHRLTQQDKGFTAHALYGCQSPASLAAFNANFFSGSPINHIGGMVTGPDGSIYLASTHQSRILKFSPAGSMSVVAGTGTAQFTPDGQMAAGSPLNSPVGLSMGPDGSLYFVEFPYLANSQHVDAVGSRVRRISPQGVLSTVAGTGASGDSGDGLAATLAQFTAASVAMAPDGRLFIADFIAGKIKMVDTQGVLHTIAGMENPSGAPGSATAPFPSTSEVVDAMAVILESPSSLAVTKSGTVYFVDSTLGQVLQLRQNANGGWGLSVVFGVRRSSECSTLAQQGSATASDVGSAIKNSLAVLCEGSPNAITVKDTCPAAGGDTRIAFSQTVGQYANVVEIVKPCGT